MYNLVNLVSLHLDNNSIQTVELESMHFLQHLIIKSTSVTSISIDGCYHLRTFKVKNAVKLTYLGIEKCDIENVQINAPNLDRLHINAFFEDGTLLRCFKLIPNLTVLSFGNFNGVESAVFLSSSFLRGLPSLLPKLRVVRFYGCSGFGRVDVQRLYGLFQKNNQMSAFRFNDEQIDSPNIPEEKQKYLDSLVFCFHF